MLFYLKMYLIQYVVQVHTSQLRNVPFNNVFKGRFDGVHTCACSAYTPRMFLPHGFSHYSRSSCSTDAIDDLYSSNIHVGTFTLVNFVNVICLISACEIHTCTYSYIHVFCAWEGQCHCYCYSLLA